MQRRPAGGVEGVHVGPLGDQDLEDLVLALERRHVDRARRRGRGLGPRVVELGRRHGRNDFGLLNTVVALPLGLERAAARLDAPVPAVRGDGHHVVRVQVVVVLLAAHLDEPLVAVPLLLDELHLGRAADLVGRPLAHARAGVLAGAAAVAHHVDAHNVGVRCVLAAGRLGLGAAGHDEHVALRDGVFLDGPLGLLALVVGAQHQGRSDGREFQGRDGLDQWCDVFAVASLSFLTPLLLAFLEVVAAIFTGAFTGAFFFLFYLDILHRLILL